MIKHYLKVAFRNLWKYKSQTLISVVGLAVGFTCFALATLWIRYETTYDGFLKNADKLYCVLGPDANEDTGISRNTGWLSTYLKMVFPEIKRATAINLRKYLKTITIDKKDYDNVDVVGVDSSFFDMFGIKIIDGNKDFLVFENKKIAITQENALKIFGNESPIGKIITFGEHDFIVSAIVTGLPKHSNYRFDFLYSGSSSDGHAVIELSPNVDVKTFEKKLYEHKNLIGAQIKEMSIIPLTEIHYKDPNAEREVDFQHIVIFALAGSLVILCTLFNYLALFISRFRIRRKEMALRMVFGASGRSLFTLLSVEFALSLIIALSAGIFLIEIAFPSFQLLSKTGLELSSVYLEAIVYIIAIILISLLIFIFVLMIFRRRTLNAAIHKTNKKLFRKISVVVQLVISMGFAFCTIVIIKQMHYLHNTDLGFAFKNRAMVMLWETDANVLENQLKQIPEITGTVKYFYPLLPFNANGNTVLELADWDDKPDIQDKKMIGCAITSEQYADYYELQLLDGEMLNENEDRNYVLINESAAKFFGWHKPVGKTFSIDSKALYSMRMSGWNNPVSNYIVKGVIKNINNIAPTITAQPYFYARIDTYKFPIVLIKYKEGTWKSCKEKINKMMKENYPDSTPIMHNTEEEYDKFLKSENNLLKLLTFVSLVCIIICVFGFVSLVSLTCEERRKEIAIRKINGATVKDILDIFFKEYIVLLVIGAAIAFPLGYYIMRRWLEEYVVQTPISAWIYAVILLALILSIILCVGWKVYKTSRENPAAVVKS